ncbi:YueI family protein [Streptococcus macacae]|uniref:DUF1694 domain-containing protein n=1 Tax=Streptococcus macacae NCTC 11558 TaxID=764298 RepID=G5JYZ7_9STRE|nr:YueI family protein [Streptococcus macacae]EHJ53160.1 hypothetical protein STRMA_0413 [Streptococcus macacae NCTC 11558]SUN78253.1 glycogen synthase [Streptococcus macacae NCTC 11558]
MVDLNQKILESACGEHQLNPDEQRKYFGTFKERVLLTILLKDAENSLILNHFSDILASIQANYPQEKVTVKISANLSLAKQMDYMKKAQQSGLTATIINDDKKRSPFGILIHTDKAENLKHTDVRLLYPQIFAEKTKEPKQKKSFWQKWFNS